LKDIYFYEQPHWKLQSNGSSRETSALLITSPKNALRKQTWLSTFNFQNKKGVIELTPFAFADCFPKPYREIEGRTFAFHAAAASPARTFVEAGMRLWLYQSCVRSTSTRLSTGRRRLFQRQVRQ